MPCYDVTRWPCTASVNAVPLNVADPRLDLSSASSRHVRALFGRGGCYVHRSTSPDHYDRARGHRCRNRERLIASEAQLSSSSTRANVPSTVTLTEVNC